MKTIAVLLLSLIAALPVLAGANNVAIAYKVKGEVTVFKAGSKTGSALAPATHLSDGDRIKTGKDGYVFLIFVEDKTQIKVRENTDISISANRGAKGLEQQVNVDIGKVWTQVTKEGGKMRIGTPTSVASVKGTMWWTIVDENGVTQVITLDGIVNLLNRASGQSGDVGAGQTGNSGPGGFNVGPTQGGIPNPEGIGQRSTIRIPFTAADGTTHDLLIEYEE